MNQKTPALKTTARPIQTELQISASRRPTACASRWKTPRSRASNPATSARKSAHGSRSMNIGLLSGLSKDSQGDAHPDRAWGVVPYTVQAVAHGYTGDRTIRVRAAATAGSDARLSRPRTRRVAGDGDRRRGRR